MKKIKKCCDLIEESNESLASGKWFAAASSLQSVLALFRVADSPLLKEDTVKILPAIKKEVASQKNKLTLKLKEKWNESVSVKINDNVKNKKKTLNLSLKNGHERPFVDEIGDLIQALHATDSLENITHSFLQHIKNDFLPAIIFNSIELDVNHGLFTISLENGDGPRSSPVMVLNSLKLFISFLATNFNVPVGKEKGTFLEKIGSLLSPWFTHTVIQ